MNADRSENSAAVSIMYEVLTRIRTEQTDWTLATETRFGFGGFIPVVELAHRDGLKLQLWVEDLEEVWLASEGLEAGDLAESWSIKRQHSREQLIGCLTALATGDFEAGDGRIVVKLPRRRVLLGVVPRV